MAATPAAPDLRMGTRGRWTPASLRDHYRWQISTHDGMDRLAFAYGVLNAVINDECCRWSRVQIRAIAEGLELGMAEGTK